MGAVPVAMAMGAPVLQAWGGYMQASGEADALRASARQDEANARNVEIQSAAEEDLQRRRAGAVMGEQRAAIAQSGFGSGGTMADLVGESAANSELDALAIRFQGRVKADTLRGQAQQKRYTAKQTKRAAGIGLATSVLGAVASGYGAYATMGGTPDKLMGSVLGPKNVMRHSAIPRGQSAASSAAYTLRGY